MLSNNCEEIERQETPTDQTAPKEHRKENDLKRKLDEKEECICVFAGQ